jgi:acetyl-CoA carboxylase biotin carboxyl carrier protein
MDFKQIQELIKIINKSNIGEVTIEEDGKKVTIKQKKDPSPIIAGGSYAAPTQSVVPIASAAGAIVTTSAPAVAPIQAVSSNLITIKSPMIGTFYRRSSPDKPLFVEVGTEITVGKVLCIIEAMKLFNEIESEVKGKIVKILVEDNMPVEYDQPLYLVDPS